MSGTALAAGTATAVGSLPHHDAVAAASLVLRCLPELPAVPQLPCRTPLESVIAQWVRAIPGIDVAADGSIVRGGHVDPCAPIDTTFDCDAHAGLLAFIEVAGAHATPLPRMKAQVTGPLTLGVALTRAGVPADKAFPLAVRVARGWAEALQRLVAERLPHTALVLFLDEPALVAWRDDEPPLDRETATDLLSTSLAAVEVVSGVHVCGAGDVRLALDAGPQIVHLDAGELRFDDAIALSRFLEGDGWIAWGAIPTHGPIGEQAAPLWKALLDVWCELTRRGCDPARVRQQALVAPACGLSGHGPSQAERAMLLAREIGQRVHDHAVATKLAVGA
jgi:hypothetical protein